MAQFVPQLSIWNTMNGGKKVVGLCESKKQPITI